MPLLLLLHFFQFLQQLLRGLGLGILIRGCRLRLGLLAFGLLLHWRRLCSRILWLLVCVRGALVLTFFVAFLLPAGIGCWLSIGDRGSAWLAASR